MSRRDSSSANIIQSWLVVDNLVAPWQHQVGDELRYCVYWQAGARVLEFSGSLLSSAGDQAASIGALTTGNYNGVDFRYRGRTAQQYCVCEGENAANQQGTWAFHLRAGGNARMYFDLSIPTGLEVLRFNNARFFDVLPV